MASHKSSYGFIASCGGKLRAHKGRVVVTVEEQTACTRCLKLCVLGSYFSDSMNIIALNDDKQSVCVCMCALAHVCNIVALWWRVQCSHAAIPAYV